MKDNLGNVITGTVYDEITAEKDSTVVIDGREIEMKAGETYKIPVDHNIVLNSSTVILASLIKGDDDFFGKVWWEVGSGSSDWNDEQLPNPTLNDSKLVKPLYRKVVAKEDIKFLTPDTNKVSENPTNKIEMSVVFYPEEANGHLREFSIYLGGDEKLSSGLPFNRKIHGTIFKTEGIKLTRKIHFLFTLR